MSATGRNLAVVDAIGIKRDGGELDDASIRSLILDYTVGRIPDEQMAALLMAVYLRGMNDAECFAWTRACIDSGTRLDWSHLGGPIVDKHSTGGVGDKVTLVLAPLMAALGAKVPQISGRGLGHTGGTLDKLEAIASWQARLDVPAIDEVLQRAGAVIVAATEDLAPADGKLYALRDVTGTVASIPLIAASIMSKKIASGAKALVLDVKVGSGAFMKDRLQAEELAKLMIRIGAAEGVATRAVLTRMDSPLGYTAGNALEVAEAIATLRGDGPDDLVELVLLLAQELSELAGLPGDSSTEPGRRLLDGSALRHWELMVQGQGGNLTKPLPQARHIETIRADRNGRLNRLDAHTIGLCAWRLGAGRKRKEDPVSSTAGVRWRHKPGDLVTRGSVLLELHGDDPDVVADTVETARAAYRIDDQRIDQPPLVLGRFS